MFSKIELKATGMVLVSHCDDYSNDPMGVISSGRPCHNVRQVAPFGKGVVKRGSSWHNKRRLPIGV